MKVDGTRKSTHCARTIGDPRPEARICSCAARRPWPAISSSPPSQRVLEKQAPPQFPGPGETTTQRRLGLAHWIASEQNPLTARVIVNRVWQQHFGQGLVATANDFGLMGAPPSNPELLDWLAFWFMHEAHWSLKKLHWLILTSSALAERPRPPIRRCAIAVSKWRRCAIPTVAVSGQLNPKRSSAPR